MTSLIAIRKLARIALSPAAGSTLSTTDSVTASAGPTRHPRGP